MNAITPSAVDLSTLCTKDLQVRFCAVFGQPTASRNRPWLIRRLQSAVVTTAELLQSVLDTPVATAPVDPAPAAEPAPADSAIVSTTELVPDAPAAAASADSVTAAEPASADDADQVMSTRSPFLPVGSTIKKTWKGQTLAVTVTADGFRLKGKTYPSLSAAATALCGGNRNGLVFFGLKPRPAKAAP